MATVIAKVQCCLCNKERHTYKCGGCAKDFCFNHLTEHRLINNKEFDEIDNDHDQFRQGLEIENQLNHLARQLQQLRREDELNEIDLNEIKAK